MNDNTTNNQSQDMINNNENVEAKGAVEQSDLHACQEQVNEWKDKFVRLTSDFENFKRRNAREQMQVFDKAQAKVLKDILDIVDDFDRAFASHQSQQEMLAGFTMIRAALQKLLIQYSVQEMTNYQEFDPNYHEALGQVSSADHQSGQIVQVLQKGYLFKDTVLRPARVMVAQ